MSRADVELPAFISQAESFTMSQKDLKMWLRITNVDKKLQVEAVIHSLDGHVLRIKEKIQIGIRNKVKGNELRMKNYI